MNPLEAIKQKMMVKPQLEQRQRVAVIIKGENPVKKREKKEVKEDEEDEEEQPITEIIEEKEEKKRPLIVDETSKGFDRQAFLKKLKESTMTKVVTKPIIEEAEKKQVIEPLPLPVKKAKKIDIKKPLIIEDDE
jgi:hypothetical protein